MDNDKTNRKVLAIDDLIAACECLLSFEGHCTCMPNRFGHRCSDCISRIMARAALEKAGVKNNA